MVSGKPFHEIKFLDTLSFWSANGYVIHVRGIVQGFGFRPFVYRLAKKLEKTLQESKVMGYKDSCRWEKRGCEKDSERVKEG